MLRISPPFPFGQPRTFRATLHGTVFSGRDDHIEQLQDGDVLRLIPDPPVQEAPEVWVHMETGEPIGHLPPDGGGRGGNRSVVARPRKGGPFVAKTSSGSFLCDQLGIRTWKRPNLIVRLPQRSHQCGRVLRTGCVSKSHSEPF